MAQVLVFVPLPEEMRYAYDLMHERGAVTDAEYDESSPVYVFEWRRHDRRKATVEFRVIQDMGNLRTALRVLPALLDNQPNICLLTGIAGSLDERAVTVGDVIVGTHVKTYYADKIKQLHDASEEFVDIASGSAFTAGKIHVDERKRYLQSSFFRYRRDELRLDGSAGHAQQYVIHARNTGLALSSVDPAQVQGLPDGLTNSNPKIRFAPIFGADFVVELS